MPSTTTYDGGEVVVVNVLFSSQSGFKPRPAVVVSTNNFHRDLPDVIVCPISSQPQHYAQPGSGGCPLVHWKGVGLRYPSTVRVSNIVAVEKTIIKRVLGMLSDDDLDQVRKRLRHAFGL